MSKDEVGTTAPDSYSQYVPVDRNRLKDLGISEASQQQFAATRNTTPLNIIEFFQALPYFPIAFLSQQNGSYMPCAILGLNLGENLFTDDNGKWQDGVYSPAYIRRYPFITEVITNDKLGSNGNDLTRPIFVDEAALVKNAPALFIANGVATPEWETIESFISDYVSAENQSLLFTQKLVDLKLLEPFDAQIHPNQGEMTRLKGLYRINEGKLNKLPAKVVKDLMQSGELSRIYAHLISLENFAKLLDRKAERSKK